MRKLVIFLLIAYPIFAIAQKEIKPSIPNAEKALRANKLDEAKAIIDLTTASNEFMIDKKGNPSKSAAKAWFLKGVIYLAIDTTKNEKFKELDSDPFRIAKESFEKANQIDQKNPAFLIGADGFPLINDNVIRNFANAYLQNAIDELQQNSDYQKSFENSEKTLSLIPNDTLALLYAGLYFCPPAEEYDKSITYLNSYLEQGGINSDAFLLLIENYYTRKKMPEEALRICRRAETVHPTMTVFKQNEIGILIGMQKYEEAKQMVEASVQNEPNKENYLMLGMLNEELGNKDKAKEAYTSALKVDPKYFDAAVKLADIYWKDAKEIKDKMASLSMSQADMAKLKEFDKQYVEKAKLALPFIEQAEKISPDDINILYVLETIYLDLDMKDRLERVKKRLKELGEDVD